MWWRQMPLHTPRRSSLRRHPRRVGKIGTSMVRDKCEGGHGLKALARGVTGYVKCRIVPGHSNAEIIAELSGVADEPALTIAEINPEDVVEADASPYDQAFVDAATRAVRAAFGDVPVIASQASGASDSMWYRALGVPSYGASGTFTKDSDDYSHGLNERVPIGNIARSLAYYHALLSEQIGRAHV